MAKTKSRKPAAKGADTNGRKILIIAGAVLLAMILAFSIGFGVKYARAEVGTDAPQTFYVDVYGSRYYGSSQIRLADNSLTKFKCYDESANADEEKHYTVKVYSAVTSQTVFSYTVNGSKRMFMGGEDYTQYFDITGNADGFELANVKDTPATILQRRFAGLTVVAPATDPDISYFTLVVTSADGSQSVNFALTFGNVKIELDPDGGIVL